MFRHVDAIRANTATSQVQESHDTDEVDIRTDLNLIVIGIEKPIVDPTSRVNLGGRWPQPGDGVLMVGTPGAAHLVLAARTGSIMM